MKLANNPLVLTDNGVPYGVRLPPNGYREHEVGIQRINQILRVSSAEDLPGIEQFRVGRIPDRVIALGDYGEWRILLLDEFIGDQEGIYTVGKYYLELGTGREIRAAWSNEDFAIAMRGEGKTFLDDLYEAFKIGDVAVYYTKGGNPFGDAFTIMIISRVPESVKQKFLQ
ncbi:MAG TPA: hypothetical protein P5080_05685 [Candidatus Paceibacterota bacterium]|nr:hypothetical protein [Candidatus Pacearchaeota archaeon]HRZ51440.1 hypothetical protein [Candidatus Paceibacterota bacterium]HSA37159.1 hypothetical protein [Candidatus Paceibacterota bacterium]